MFKKCFKILLVSWPYYLKLQGSHYFYPGHLSFSVVSGKA